MRLSAVMLTAGFLSSSGAFAQSIQVDEYNFLFPTNQLNEEANALAVRALGFATNNFSATVANETATAFGSADVFGEWIATTPFANGQVQVFNFNICFLLEGFLMISPSKMYSSNERNPYLQE